MQCFLFTGVGVVRLRGWDSAVGVGEELHSCAESGWTTLPTFLSLVVVVSALDPSLMDWATGGGGEGGGRELGSIIKPDVFQDCAPFGIASAEFTGWVPKAAFIPVVTTGLCLGLATSAYVLLAGEVEIAERSLSKLCGGTRIVCPFIKIHLVGVYFTFENRDGSTGVRGADQGVAGSGGEDRTGSNTKHIFLFHGILLKLNKPFST